MRGMEMPRRENIRKKKVCQGSITFNVPVVYMGRDEVICNIHFKGLWKGWALKIDTFVGPEMATSEARAIGPFQGPQKSRYGK